MTVRWTVRAAPGPPAGGESLIARHVVADFTCSRRRFFVSQNTRHPCCGARLFRRSQRSLEKFDRGHSLASLFPPPAAVGSLPLVPSLLLFGEKTVPAASGLLPCGRRSLSFFSDSRFARKRSRTFQSDGAPRALLNSLFLISHSSFLTPRPPCERGSNPRPARFAFFSPKGVSRFDI